MLEDAAFERDIRVGFVRKVLGIVAFQLAFTLGLAYQASANENLALVIRNPVTVIMAAFLVFFSLSALMCCNLTK